MILSKNQMDYFDKCPRKARNVFIRFSDNLLACHGGLYASVYLTNAELSKMIRIVFHAEGAFSIYLESTDIELLSNEQIVRRGIYVLRPLRDGASISVTSQLILDRKLDSRHTNRNLVDQVRYRDHGHCTIHGMLRPNQQGKWPTTKMAYIFPSGQGDVFSLLPFPTPPEGVHCAQNVITLEERFYYAWETGRIAVDPDNGYRIVSFHPSTQSCHRMKLHPVCRDPGDPLRVNDDLLRWHYHQTVIKNMRGDGKDHLRYPHPSDLTVSNPLMMPYRGGVYRLFEPPPVPASIHAKANNGPLNPADRDRTPTNKHRQPIDIYEKPLRKREERSN